MLLVHVYFILGIVGEIEEGGREFFVWTHKKFDIGYNEDRITDVNLTSEAKVKLSTGVKISFSYEVRNIECFINIIIYR